MRALGSDLRLAGRGAERVAAEVRRLEQILTRFRASPLTALNAAGCLADPPSELVAALRWALDVARATAGLVTPLVGPLMVWHGYARPWPHRSHRGSGAPPKPGAAEEVVVRDDLILLPPGAALDLGGTAKTWIAERAAAGFDGPFVIDAGGDVWLDRPEGSEVDVAPVGGADAWHLRLPPGRWGVATSSVVARAWPGGHHLMDPRTRRPAATRWAQATVVARSARVAEVVTKLVLLDVPWPPELAVEAAWATTHDGRTFTHTTGGWLHEVTSIRP
jgi:FAD:protein FMN transferase